MPDAVGTRRYVAGGRPGQIRSYRHPVPELRVGVHATVHHRDRDASPLRQPPGAGVRERLLRPRCGFLGRDAMGAGAVSLRPGQHGPPARPAQRPQVSQAPQPGRPRWVQRERAWLSPRPGRRTRPALSRLAGRVPVATQAPPQNLRLLMTTDLPGGGSRHGPAAGPRGGPLSNPARHGFRTSSPGARAPAGATAGASAGASAGATAGAPAGATWGAPAGSYGGPP